MTQIVPQCILEFFYYQKTIWFDFYLTSETYFHIDIKYILKMVTYTHTPALKNFSFHHFKTSAEKQYQALSFADGWGQVFKRANTHSGNGTESYSSLTHLQHQETSKRGIYFFKKLSEQCTWAYKNEDTYQCILVSWSLFYVSCWHSMKMTTSTLETYTKKYKLI